MGVWASEKVWRKAGSGTTEDAVVTSKSKLDIREYLSMINETFQTRLPGRDHRSKLLYEWSLHGLHKGLSFRVTLNDKAKASLPFSCSHMVALFAQTLMNQPHLPPISHFSEGNCKK